MLGLLFYLAAGDPNLAPPIHVSAIVSGLRASVLHYAEMFIVGHEYVHIMAGDLAQSGTKVRRALGSCDISSCQWDHKSEIAADLTSTCLLATHSADRYLGMNRALHFMNLARTHFKTQLSVNLRHA